MNTLYKTSDRELLKAITAIDAGFHKPAVGLDGLTDEQALTKPHGLPHSIAEIVAHMWYWQEFFNRAAREGFSDFPEHAEEGWPKVAPGEWDAVRDRFLASVEAAQNLAMTCDKLDDRLLPEGFPIPFWERESFGSGLLHGAVHGAHHLGQVVILRQLMGLWPPAAGSMTW